MNITDHTRCTWGLTLCSFNVHDLAGVLIELIPFDRKKLEVPDYGIDVILYTYLREYTAKSL